MLLTSTRLVNQGTWLVNQDLVDELGLLATESGLSQWSGLSLSEPGLLVGECGLLVGESGLTQ